jgi:transposase-like protein
MTGTEEMSRGPHRNQSAALKAKVAIRALRDGKTVAEIAQKHDLHTNQVTEWLRYFGVDGPLECLLVKGSTGTADPKWRITRADPASER